MSNNNRKNIFKTNYTGPSGPHLSCLTETTMYGDYTESLQKSIHPMKKVTKPESRFISKED